MPELILDPIKLRRTRLQAALTQAALAERAGVRTVTVVRAERGVRSTVSTVRKLADALQVPPTSIATLIDPRP